MFKSQQAPYVKGSVEEFFRNLAKMLNNLSEDPLNEDLNCRVRIPFFPLSWDLSQFYFLLKAMYKIKLFDHMGFIITNRDYSKINEIFMFRFIETNEEELHTEASRFNFEIISFKEKEHATTLEKLNEYISNFDVKAFKFLESFLKTEYNFTLGHLFILPEHIAHVGVLQDTEYINNDAIRYFKDFFRLLRLGLSQNLEKMPVIQYSSKGNRQNPIVNLFIKFATEWAKIPINDMFDFMAKMQDGRALNILIFDSNEKPIVISRMNIEQNAVHFNPVPINFLRKYLTGEATADMATITKTLYQYTKTSTVAFKFETVTDLLKTIATPKYTFPNALLDLVQFIFNSNIYPEATLSQILGSLGINCTKFMPKLKQISFDLMEYYEKIAIALVSQVEHETRHLSSIITIQPVDKNNLSFEQLDKERFAKLFDNKEPADIIDEFSSKLLKETGVPYPLVVIIGLTEISEIFSYKNIHSLMEMAKFAQNLPSLEKFAAVFRTIGSGDIKTEKGSDNKLSKETESKIEQIAKSGINLKRESIDTYSFLEGLPSINHFLKEGLVVKVSGDKQSIIGFEPGKEGSLGLEIKKIKEFIKNKMPDVLLD